MVTAGTYVYVTPFFPSPENWRGGFSLDAVKALMRAGWRVEVFTGVGRGEPEDDYVYEGVKVHRFARIQLPCELMPFAVEGVNAKSFLECVRRAGLSPEQVVVCHAHTVFYGVYAEALKRINPKIVTALHHHFAPPFHLRSGRLGEIPGHATLLYRHWRKRCSAMDVQVFPSKRAQAMFGKDESGENLRSHLMLGRWMKNFCRGCEYVMYNGVDRSVFKPGASSRNGHEDQPVVGCVANFFPGKGQMRILRAVKMLKEMGLAVKTRFVGTGPTRRECELFAAEHQLSVEFLMEMDHTKLPDFYRGLDLYLMPSYSEAFNCTCVEASGCGVPVIGYSTVPYLDEAMTDDRGLWIAPVDDDRRLAELIKSRLEDRLSQTFAIDCDIDHITAEWTKWLGK